MNILKMITLYGVFTKYPIGDIAARHINISRNKLMSIRITGLLYFSILKWYSLLTNHSTINTPKGACYPKTNRSKTRGHIPKVDLYLKDLCNTLPDWNIFTKLNGSVDIHEASVVSSYNPETSEYLNLDNSFYHTTRLACGLGRLYLTTKDQLYLVNYTKLLDGVDRMLKHTPYQHRVTAYPDTLIGEPTTVLDLDSIACLLSLISIFSHDSDTHTGHLEECVRDKFISIIEYTDYVLTSDNIPVVTLDLAPSIIYNNTKCFAYTIIRIIQNKLNKNDVTRFMIFLNMRPKLPTIKLQDVITCAIMLETMINLVRKRKNTALMDRRSNNELVKLSISWITYFSYTVEQDNPEIDSILANMYSQINDYANAEYTASNTASIINILFDNHVLRKTEDVRTNYFNSLKPCSAYTTSRYRLPLLRCNTEYYWTVPALPSAGDALEYPVFEYITVYSRIYELLTQLT